MDVDEDDDGTQRALQAKDYGIVVDFVEMEDEEKEVGFPTGPIGAQRGRADNRWSWSPSPQNGSEEFGEALEASIAKLDAEIVRMAPNMKAADK